MMTQTSPQPHPLTRTNVTQHDRIWEKRDPTNFFGFNLNDTAFSPPLKHITPDTAKELWENFDPLDVLDSGSESSCDTMIMMNTEEEMRNEASIQRSNQAYEQRQSQHGSSYEFALNSLHTIEEQESPVDEGYGTDHRTNTSASLSLSSPLSSSLSSLSTSESCSSQGSTGKQNAPTARVQQITSSGRVTVNSRPMMPVRKVTKNVESPEKTQSLEERLRALTTIEEEEAGSNSDQEKQPRLSSRSLSNHTSDCRGVFENKNVRNQNVSGQQSPRSILRNSENKNTGQQGIFHAVPVQLASRGSKLVDSDCIVPNSPTSRQEWIHRVEKMGYVPHSDVKYYDTLWNDKNIQMGMSEKNNTGKHLPQFAENVDSDLMIKDKQKAGSHMVSMPDLRLDRQGYNSSCYDDSVVKMRRKPPMKRDRYSWGDFSSAAYQAELANHKPHSDRLSEHGGESPRLQDQFRAMSELSLGIKKPLYASSADIYKLFQGQGQGQGEGHYGLSRDRKASHRHSFHTVPSGQSWLQAMPQSSEEMMKQRMRSASMSIKNSGIPPKKPMRLHYSQPSGDNSNSAPFVMAGRSVIQNPPAKTDSKLSTLV